MRLPLILLLWGFTAAVARPLQFPPHIDHYVNDWADLLSDVQEMQLEKALRDYEARTSNQFVIATFPSLEGESLEDVSIRMFESWGIGQKGRDNGVLITVFKKEHRIRIEVGYGLEDKIPDALAARIIRREMRPAFRQGQYFTGLALAVQSLAAAAGGKFQGEGLPRRRQQGGSWLGLLVPLLFFYLLLRGRMGGLGWFFLGSMMGSGFGGRGDDGFGGFGGFSGGGGMAGGGGASGGW